VVFVLAFLMMFGLEKLILAAHRWVKRPIKVQPLFGDLVPRSEAGRQGLFRQASSPALLVLSVLGILMGVAAWRLDRPPNAIYVQNNAAKALPADLSVQDNKLSCTEMTLDENTLTLLNTRDYLYRRYSGLDKPVDICIIFSKDNPTSSHPPELCLTAGGGDVLVSNDVVLDRVPEMLPVDCRELVVQQRQGGLLTYYVYTFKYGKSYTKRFAWQQVWLFFKSRLFGGDASGALIRVSTPIANNDSRSIDEARRRAQEFMRASLPYLDRGLD
jgi:EpsI family protein